LGTTFRNTGWNRAGSTMRYMDASISVGRQKIRFDREETIELYRGTASVPGADSCDCLYCRNFAKQRLTIYPDDFKKLLDRLGADRTKEWEAYELGPSSTKPDHRLYGGWFLFCGELVEGADVQAEGLPFSFRFTNSFPNGTLPDDGIKICAVDFLAEIPWVLPEAPD
jgi:hypothetical protein